MTTQLRTSTDNETEAYFTTCNVTRMAYVALFEGPPGIEKNTIKRHEEFNLIFF